MSTHPDLHILRIFEDEVERLMQNNNNKHAEGPVPCHYVLGLTSEAGEVADLVNKRYFFGKPLDLQSLEEELGDTLWYLTALALHHGLSLESIMKVNILKLRDRYPDGFDPSRR